MTELSYLTIKEIGDLFRSGSLSPLEYTHDLLTRIDADDGQLNAFLGVAREQATTQARAATEDGHAGRWRGSLHGIPYGLKDIIDHAGLPTTAHSAILQDNIATTDATVTGKLRSAGGLCVGKLATHEFAIGGPSFDLPWPPARNPWDPTRHPGGSSSGSGAAVAAGLVPAALGTDTGGSVRNPASMCGIVGLKPTYGLVSRTGVVPLAFSLDHVGPLARTVKDAALVLNVIAGPDRRDPTSASPAPTDYTSSLRDGLHGMRIGYVRHFHDGDLPDPDPEMVAGIDAAADALRGLGAEVREVAMRPLDEYATVQRVIQMAEAYSVHQRWLRSRPEDYGTLARQRLLAGAFVSGADYVSAVRTRRIMSRDFARTMQDLDALICASSMEPAVELTDSAELARTYRRHPRMAFNLLGNPALAVPTGFSSLGLPLGMQIVGRHFDEATVLRVGHAYEQGTEWHRTRPPAPASHGIG